MGAPVPEMTAAGDSTAEALLSSLKTIAAGERRKHASVLNYWHSIRANRQFPPLRDLDPLEISDAGPFSVLLEMIGAGEDAEIRHLGQEIKAGVEVERIGEAPEASLLSRIAARLPVVAESRQAFAFEDEFDGPDGVTRCWVTLLPFSAAGTWIDYVYGFVSLDPGPDAVEQAVESVEQAPEDVEATIEPVEQALESEPQPAAVEPDAGTVPVEPEPEPSLADAEPEPEPAPSLSGAEPELEPANKPGFSAKLLESLSNVGSYYGKVVEAKQTPPPAPIAKQIASEQPNQPIATAEGTLQSKLAEVRAKAEEARLAKLRSYTALYEGLSAAYDFALDAEDQPEDYLKLVEAQGLKIQLRSPMAPVMKLAFDGMCDDATIAKLETVLAWALKLDLPRGTLAERIEVEGGIGPILAGQARAA